MLTHKTRLICEYVSLTRRRFGDYGITLWLVW